MLYNQDEYYQKIDSAFVKENEVFVKGDLLLSVVPLNNELKEYPKEELPFHPISMLVAIIMCLFCVKTIIHISRALFDNLLIWRKNFEFEGNIQFTRDRNIIYRVALIPFCMIVSHYRIYDLDFIKDFLPEWHFLLTLMIYLSYSLVKNIIHNIFCPKGFIQENYQVGRLFFRSYFIMLTICLVSVVLVLDAIKIDYQQIKQICTYMIILFYCLYILRKNSIFSTFCRPFIAILYLCVLEFLPAGLLMILTFFF